MRSLLKSLCAAIRSALLSESALVRQMAERPVLDDEAFFETYYGAVGIPRDIPIRTRAVIAEQLGKSWRGIRPDDNIPQMDLDLPFEELMFEVEKEFGVRIPLEEISSLDGSFDSVIRYIFSLRCRTP
jgi:acyl carrier protein